MNRLQELNKYGQSVWLDYIRRSLIDSGELKRLINEDGLRGVTSNPSIFEKAIAGSNDYKQSIGKMSSQQGAKAKVLYEHLAVNDIQDAADILHDVYVQTNKLDGYVSLEVSPNLAHDTEGTLSEARRLWKDVGRENVMIKVPGTNEGVAAIRQLISEGININVTLLFSQEYYAKAAEAFTQGLEIRSKRGESISQIASVASFFISRIDSLVDKLIDDKIKIASETDKHLLEHLKGKIAIANAKQTYQYFKEFYASPRWRTLADKGAQKQRLLWASTSTKNPQYRDVLYVEELIGRETVNTIPPATFDAFRDHGQARLSIEEAVEDAADQMLTLAKLGISFEKATDQLLIEGIDLFIDAFNKLIEAVEKKRQALVSEHMPVQAGAIESVDISQALSLWDKSHNTHRLWARDSSLWTGADEGNWMGWLGVTEVTLAQAEELMAFADEIKASGVKDVVLLGMGGSSLCPQVLQHTFGSQPGYPKLHVLDSTDPAQVKSIEDSVDVKKTLFIVSSKSGGTLEPNIFKQYFFARSQNFIAVTDPDTKMESIAKRDGFKYIFHGIPSIGGRYSALSNFGMVPAALLGIDLKRFLNCTEEMVHACSATVSAHDNPGVFLGVTLGVLAKRGQDKVTLVTSPKIADLGAWLEQLLAESTGKEGKGLIPVDKEPLGAPLVYGHDRVFAYIRLDASPDAAQDAAIDAIEKAGHPVIRLHMSDIDHLGAEFFRWEIATAVAGSILGINAFNQPDVEASKIATRKLTTDFEATQKLPPRESSPIKDLAAHLSLIQKGDYFDISAYIEMNDEHERILQECRQLVRDRKQVATCLGFGPRFLHSTGQAYKGGPNSGVFLQITCDDAHDLAIPDQKYTFGLVKECQARGDFAVLKERGRRAMRIHISGDLKSGLSELRKAFIDALK